MRLTGFATSCEAESTVSDVSEAVETLVDLVIVTLVILVVRSTADNG
jgi:hypothetical protein